MIEATLIDDVDLLCLDAGNTVVFLDHARLATIANQAGFSAISGSLLATAEGEAKRLTSHPEKMIDVDWKERNAPGAAPWGRTVATMLAHAGVPISELPHLVSRIWESHVGLNLWSLVPEGFVESIAAIRQLGIKVVIVSNSEGMLDRLFTELGIFDSFDAIVDSGKVGVEKPDKRIFEIACELAGKPADRALHLGDTFATDVLGARRANIRTALIDPHNHYENLHLDVPRVPGAVEVARALATNRPRTI